VHSPQSAFPTLPGQSSVQVAFTGSSSLRTPPPHWQQLSSGWWYKAPAVTFCSTSPSAQKPRIS